MAHAQLQPKLPSDVYLTRMQRLIIKTDLYAHQRGYHLPAAEIADMIESHSVEKVTHELQLLAKLGLICSDHKKELI